LQKSSRGFWLFLSGFIKVAPMFTRRDFLTTGMHLASASVFAGMLEEALGAGKRSSPIWASRELRGQGGSGAAPQGPNAEGMIVYSEEYVTREMPMSLLKSWITPAEHFFVRNNEHMPEVNLADWRLSVTGEVARPLTLTMDEFAKIEPRSVTNTLECAGNGRAFFQPRIKGVPWARGGVGNAVFKGPPLGELLRLAGAKSAARHVAFRGTALPSRDPQFIRSIPIDKAMDADTIVATHMNGLPLTPEQGYPARALVPGWIGSASIKWLTEIRVMTHEFEGYYMDSAYRLPSHAGASGAKDSAVAQRALVITSLPVKSVIAMPAEGSTILAAPQPAHIFGAAWAGTATVARVDISTDGGTSWQPAALGAEHARYTWRLWNFEWKAPREGSYVILSRATDSRGRRQPMEMQWNPEGYLWNAVDRVRINVAKASAL
jgi:sulfite oxidase